MFTCHKLIDLLASWLCFCYFLQGMTGQLASLPCDILLNIHRMMSDRNPDPLLLNTETLNESHIRQSERAIDRMIEASTQVFGVETALFRPAGGSTSSTASGSDDSIARNSACGSTFSEECTGRECISSQQGHALRSCCKLMRFLCDQARTSIMFHAGQQAEAVSYIQKLPNLTTVTIMYNQTSCDISKSLADLPIYIPSLKSLILGCAVDPYYSRWEQHLDAVGGVPADIKSLLLPWSGTLQRLELDHIACTSSVGMHRGGLQFLSHLTAIQILKLQSVSPALRNKDIAGCTGLVKLTLAPSATQLGIYMACLDLSPFLLLQEVSCSSCGLLKLNTEGLTALRQLECSHNNLELIHLHSATSLTYLKCIRNCLTDLDTSNCSMLCVLECDDNALSKLHLLRCSLLTVLSCASRDCKISQLTYLLVQVYSHSPAI